jgi:hypothetical protein
MPLHTGPLVQSAVLFGFTSNYMAGRTFQERLLSRVITSQPFVRTMGVRRNDSLLFSQLGFKDTSIEPNPISEVHCCRYCPQCYQLAC